MSSSRRRDALVVASAVAVLLVAGVATYAVADGDDGPEGPGLPTIATSDLAPYQMRGAWAYDDRVHIGADHVAEVAGVDELGYTSVGALAWSSASRSTTLVMPDGSTHPLDYPGLRDLPGPPGSDPGSPYIAYVRTPAKSERPEVVVVDLTTGQQQVVDSPQPDLSATDRSTVSIFGDLVIYPTADDPHHQVDWRTGADVPFEPEEPVSNPTFAGGHYARLLVLPGLVTRSTTRPGVTRWQVRSTVDDSILLDTAGETPPAEAAAFLSPDGDHLLRTTGTGVAVAAAGRNGGDLRFDGVSDVSGFGWSPNGRLISARSVERDAGHRLCYDGGTENVCVDIGDVPPGSVTLVRGVPVHVPATP